MKISNAIWKVLMEHWWIRHISFWFILVIYFAWGIGIVKSPPIIALIGALGFLPGGILVVYPFLYFLIPEFLYKKKFVTLALLFVGLIVCAKLLTIGMVLLFPRIPFIPQKLGVGHNILPFVKIAAMAATAKLIKYYFYRQEKADVAQEERIQTELELLKSQIHPNFLFNTLNNLFAHTIKNSSESPNIVLKLSDLLRFMIYESKCEFIPLDHEVQLLENYIELEKLRHGNDFDVSFVASGELDDKMIRPLLLLPLVEYAFKQASIETNDLKWVSLNIHSEHGHLEFNLGFSGTPGEKDQHAPEIINLKKRLELLYPADHSIRILNNGDVNNIILKLGLDDAATLPQHINLIRKRSYEMEMPVGG